MDLVDVYLDLRKVYLGRLKSSWFSWTSTWIDLTLTWIHAPSSWIDLSLRGSRGCLRGSTHHRVGSTWILVDLVMSTWTDPDASVEPAERSWSRPLRRSDILAPCPRCNNIITMHMRRT